MKAPQRIYQTADGELVGEGDERAAFLIAGEGTDVPAEFVAKVKAFLGEQPDEPAEAEPEAEPEPEPEEKKAEPAENKKAAPAKNKSN